MIRKFGRGIVSLWYLCKKGGYLSETGWINSVINKQSVDKDSMALPWLTYSFLSFIQDRLKNEMLLFEYGSGNSTLYWAGKLNRVFSVEHDLIWYEKLKGRLPDNVVYKYSSLDGDYAGTISETREKFDIIVIDGRRRVECAKTAPSFLKPEGVIIWDNSLRAQYKEGIDFLEKEGFRHIDFSGLNPLGNVKTVTSVFYKQPNCINI